MHRIVGMREHTRMLGRQPVTTRQARLEVEQPCDGLLLEPLDGVARRDARALGKLPGGERPIALEHLIEPKRAPQIHRAELKRPEGGVG